MIYSSEINLTRLQKGSSSYIHYKYSDDGSTFTANKGETPGKYTGILVDNNEQDSMVFGDYSWAKTSGEDGATGKGVSSIVDEYYLSTSKTSLQDGSWSSLKPTKFDASKYLWTRLKCTYDDSPATVSYTTPTLDLGWGSAQEVDAKVTTLQTDLNIEQGKLAALIKQTDTDRKNTSDKFTDITADINGINTTIGNIQTAVGDNSDDIASINSQITTINASAAGLETKVTKAQNDATAAQTTATQAADKIGLLVQSGTSQSNLVLTPGALLAIADNINLTGKVTFTSLDTSTQNKINKTIASTSTEYANSTSQTTQPASGWSTTMPAKETGKVIWSRKKVVYVDGTSAYQDYAPISGLNGKDGKDGTNGTNGKDGANGADAITLSITSSAGISFKGTQTATTLTCHVFRGGKELATTEISSLGTIRWYKDTGTTSVGTGATYTVAAGTVTSAISYTAKLEG